jgi:hypothetical protein
VGVWLSGGWPQGEDLVAQPGAPLDEHVVDSGGAGDAPDGHVAAVTECAVKRLAD